MVQRPKVGSSTNHCRLETAGKWPELWSMLFIYCCSPSERIGKPLRAPSRSLATTMQTGRDWLVTGRGKRGDMRRASSSLRLLLGVPVAATKPAHHIIVWRDKGLQPLARGRPPQLRVRTELARARSILGGGRMAIAIAEAGPVLIGPCCCC